MIQRPSRGGRGVLMRVRHVQNEGLETRGVNEGRRGACCETKGEGTRAVKRRARNERGEGLRMKAVRIRGRMGACRAGVGILQRIRLSHAAAVVCICMRLVAPHVSEKGNA